MSTRTVDIKINTTGDNAAIDKTNKSLDSLDKSQQAVNKTGTEAKTVSTSASQGFASLGQAASATASGGIGPLAGALGGLSQQLPALAGVAGPIGIAIAAFTAWASVIKAVSDNADQLQANINNIAIGNSEARVKSLIRSYKELTDQLAEASSEINRFYNAESSKDDAIKRADLAKLELESAEKRSKLDRSDQFAAPRLELEMAQKKAAIEDAATARAMERDKKAIAAQIAIEQTKSGAAGEQNNALAQEADRLMAKQQDVTSHASNKAGKWSNFFNQESIWGTANTELTRIASQLEQVKNEMAANIKTQSASAGNIASLETAASIIDINAGTQSTSQHAAAAGRRNTAADINYSQAEYARKELDALTAKETALRTRQSKEWNDVQKLKRTGVPENSENYIQQMSEWTAATTSVNQFLTTIGPLMKNLKETADSATAALNNLP